jgi:hypothetical protein
VTSSCVTSRRSFAPAAATAASSGARLSGLRIVAKTRQPRRATSTAVWRPKPEDVPVISTFRMRYGLTT